MAHASASTALHRLMHHAECAGAAMGCCYSSSQDYEAALIAERRKRGAYRAPLRQRLLPAAVILGAVMLIAGAILLVLIR